MPLGNADDSERSLPRREACATCGHRMERKWGPARETLVRFCPNEACLSFGIPSLRHVKHVVEVEDDGTVRERHKEAYSHRGHRPDFLQPA